MALKDLRISKKGKDFRFEIKRRFSYESKYRVVEKTPVEELRKALLSLFRRKPKAEKKAKAEEEEKPPTRPLMASRTVQKIGAAVAVLLLAIIAAFLYAQTFVFPQEMSSGEAFFPSLSSMVVESDIMTASDPENYRYPYHTGYAKLFVSSTDVPEIGIAANVYDSVSPSAVYVLRSSRYQAESFDPFYKSLELYLGAYSIPVNEISSAEVDSLPMGALLIVPSGYVPEQLITGEYPKLYSLMDRGVTVLYVGQAFDKMMSEGGSVVNSPAGFLALKDRKLTINKQVQLTPSSDTTLKNPLYQVSGLDGSWMFWGAMSALKCEKGFLLVVPQTLDGGWENGQQAASDVAYMVLTDPWLTPSATAAHFSALEGGEEYLELFTSTFEGDDKYMKIVGYNSTLGIGFMNVVHLQKKARGEVFSPAGHTVLPGEVEPTGTDLLIQLREPEPEEKRLFLVITNISGEVDRKGVGSAPVSLNSEPSTPYTFSLVPGNYILNVQDQDGNTYARGYMRAAAVRIVAQAPIFRYDIYRYTVMADDAPLALSEVKVSVDNGQYGTYTFMDSSYLEVDLHERGYSLPDGRHEFTFTLGGYEETIVLEKTAQASIFTDPLAIGVVLLALIIVGIGMALRREEAAIYGLDIPDFPPQETNKIPLKKDTLLKIFDKVDRKYKWKDTPLKLSEVKSGFRDMLHQGRHIFISDYNLEFILDSLIAQGMLKKELSYYCPVAWEKESGRSARYLALFRKLRDICINNAVPFTGVSKGNPYDSKITIMGQEMYVHMHEGPETTIMHVLKSIPKGPNIILVEGTAEKEELYDQLSNGESIPSLLKAELQAGSVSIKTWKEFEEMVKEMKV